MVMSITPSGSMSAGDLRGIASLLDRLNGGKTLADDMDEAEPPSYRFSGDVRTTNYKGQEVMLGVNIDVQHGIHTVYFIQPVEGE